MAKAAETFGADYELGATPTIEAYLFFLTIKNTLDYTVKALYKD